MLESDIEISGEVSWKSPSNIALVKYWGKYGRQYPSNPSISFTLEHAHTITTVRYTYHEEVKDQIQLQFSFEGEKNEGFGNKIKKYLESISDIYPLIYHLDLDIESSNSFPHSSGIASSASSMSALAMCLMSIDKEINQSGEIDINKASLLARLGSGSAARSVFPEIAIWGDTPSIKGSSNDYAIPYHEGIDQVFKTFHDDILIVSDREKSVSSRAGHALMEDNRYAEQRFQQAHENVEKIVVAMKAGNLEDFGYIVEKEALTLHALMMASDPPYMLMEANTIYVINDIQTYRKETGTPVYFTLDAGPNVHMLYPHHAAEKINELKEKLKKHCVDGRIIEDQVGQGPKRLS